MENSSSLVPECHKVPSKESLGKQATASGPSRAPACHDRSGDRPSRMLRKFLAAAEAKDADFEGMDRRDAMASKEAQARDREWKGLYLFYGSLMDPSVLQRVLGLPERPVLKPAGLYGWHVRMWGRYPILTDEGLMELTRGMVYEVEGSELKA